MNVRLANDAMEDLASIHAELSAISAAYANMALARITRALERLQWFPKIGRPARYPGHRQLSVAGTMYILEYVILDDTVWVLHIRHAAMGWPPGDDE